MSADRFTFLPHAQSRIGALATAPRPGRPRMKLIYEVAIERDGAEAGSRVDVETEVLGPGDIRSIDRAMITRVEPQPGLRGFEPNYFPLIEFRDADFPWRYSLDRRQGGKTPWLALIALEASEFTFIPSTDSPLKRIRVSDPGAALPDPRGLVYSAHVQANSAAGDVAEALGNDGAAAARLMCMRRLKPTKSYYAFLVPAYEAGRLTGLGQDGPATPFDAFAWRADAAPVDLPVYFDWRFTTDEAEDVELLLRRLRAFDAAALSERTGEARVSAADPGYFGLTFPGADFKRQSAMQIPAEGLPDMETPAALVPRMIDVLDEVIEGKTPTGENDEDPLVAFPAYGAKFGPASGVDRNSAAAGVWFDRINLDLGFREAAGMGARVVRKNQELFSHLAWSQYEDIVAANERLALLQAAQAMAERLVSRHFARLPSDVSLALAQPLLSVVQVAEGETVADALVSRGAPLSTAARSLRRLASKRGRPARRTAPGTDPAPMPGVPGDRSPTARARLGREAGAALAVDSDDPALFDRLGLIAGAAEALTPIFGDVAFTGDARTQTPVLSVARFSSQPMAEAVATTLARLPAFKAITAVGGLTAEERRAPGPVWRAPSIAQPMSGYLLQVSQDALFAGADDLPENTVAIVEENRPFIEAFLVGMNHEMNRELRWREFPTDMRGTVFRRFWNRGYPPDEPLGDDIAPIHEWRKTLGLNTPAASGRDAENLIVVIRGDIVRKLGDPVLAINIADQDGVFVAGAGQDITPSFVGRISADISYFGFEISRADVTTGAAKERAFFVIYEPAGRLRFGLDIGSADVRRARRDERRIAHGFALDALSDRPYRATRRHEGRAPPDQAPVTPAPGLGDISDWDELSWAHMPLSPSGYIDLGDSLRTPLSPNHLGDNRTSASIARAFWQRPVAGVLPVRKVV